MDLNFTKILKKLKEIHTQFPDIRFGQVLQQALDKEKRSHNVDFHDLSSKRILKALSELEAEIKKVRA